MNSKMISLVVVGCFLTLAAHAGWEYTSVAKSEGDRGASKDLGNMTMKSLVDGDNMRIEFTESANPILGAGSYMTSQDAGKTVYLVNSKEKTYAKWDMSAMLGMAGGLMEMKIENPKMKKTIEEDGGKLLGYSATHYHFTSSYSMKMSILGMNIVSDMAQEQDIWSTKELKDSAFTFKGLMQDVKTGNESFDKLIAGEKEKVQGFPLKMVTAQTTKDSKGKTQTSKTIMEVTEIKSVKTSAGQFKVPEGYTETSIFAGAFQNSGDKRSGTRASQSDNAADMMKMIQEQMKRAQQGK